MDGAPQTAKESVFDSPAWKALSETMQKAEDERHTRVLNHPDNGKEGWWIVQGMRHSAHVKASSALEAIEKAEKAEIVHDWEFPEAHFWTKDLPDAF